MIFILVGVLLALWWAAIAPDLAPRPNMGACSGGTTEGKALPVVATHTAQGIKPQGVAQ